ncbi:FG-GAP repeat domain-containing protein, partial [candidate division KSB1 bacterium]
GDIDGDGYNDIVAENITSSNIDMLVWYKYPGWNKYYIVNVEEFSDYKAYRSCDMELADIDGDGDLDIVGRIGIPNNDSDGINCWFENPRPNKSLEKNTWKRHDIHATEYIKDFEVRDFNRDGKPDIAARANENLYVYIQTNPDSWKNIHIKIHTHEGMEAGDIDNDGDPDIILNGFWLETPDDVINDKWIEHNIDSKWWNQSTGSWMDNNCKVTTADMNKDGRLDVLISNSEKAGYPVSWYESPDDLKNGQWKEHIIGFIDKCHNLKTADFDNDGDLDVLAGELVKPIGAPFPVVIFNNNGKALSWSRQELTDKGNYSAQTGDIDNDGDIDIIGLRNYDLPPIELWRNMTNDNPAKSIFSQVDERKYSIPVRISVGEYERTDKPVEIKINFTEQLKLLGKDEAFDENSIRVIETSSSGDIINSSVVFQFDKVTDYDNLRNASGTLVFILNDKTLSNSTRYIHVLFGFSGNSVTPPPFSPQISVIDDIEYQKDKSFKITTQNAVYYYHKFGSGFASMIDNSGKDWISYYPVVGSAGSYRGIPNIRPADFHPGSIEGKLESRIINQGPIKLSIQSETIDRKWKCAWEIYPYYAKMILLEKGEGPYWFLYEGTPGGKLDLDTDFWVRSDGKRGPVAERWTGDMPSPEWIYFGDKSMNRVIYLVHHEDDSMNDDFWPMRGNMTVFGFGRTQDTKTLMNEIPAHFTIGFADARNGDFTRVSKQINSAYKKLGITVGDPEIISR